ncbi:kelch-like protein [Xanthomonas phage XbC2]|nr:kelch-like protein [Xanthomonas phage XbC2]
MLPFPQLVEYGNVVVPTFLGNYEANTYSAMSVRAEMGYCRTPSGDIYALGGVNSTTYYRDFWKYTASTDTWSSLLQHPQGVRGGSAMAHDSVNNMIYVFGGSTGTPSLSTKRNDMYRYSIDTGTWSSAIVGSGTLPAARVHSTMQYYNGKLYLFGDYYTQASANTMHSYDIASNTWSTLATSPYPMSYASSSFMIGSDFYSMGVQGGSGTPGSGGTYHLMRYSTDSNVWNIMFSTSTQIGRIEYFKGTVALMGFDTGSLYKSDLSNLIFLSTIPGYAIDANIFASVQDNFILTLGGKSPVTSQAFKLT